MTTPAETEAVAALLAADASGANGDDAAVLHAAGGRVCVTTDTSLVPVHLYHDMSPFEMGYRAAACALSDLAAMAARPIGVTSALVVPDGKWEQVAELSAGIEARAAEHGCHLVGGDLVSGPGDWVITITCLGTAGSAASGGFVSRAGARAGDNLYVTGDIGLAAAWSCDNSLPWEWYWKPPNRSAAGQAVAPWAHAMCDVSDGLVTDARHIAEASGLGFTLNLDAVPVPADLQGVFGQGENRDWAVVCACYGDDYELLFAADPADEPAIRAALERLDPDLRLTNVGSIADTSRVDLVRLGQVRSGIHGYRHG